MTVDLARQNVAEGGRPFATVIVKDGEVLAESANKVAQTNDPTAHAEILAIREACMKLGTEHLVDSTIYVLAHPCPMCPASCTPLGWPVFPRARSDRWFGPLCWHSRRGSRRL